MEKEGPNIFQRLLNFLSSKDQQKFDKDGNIIPTNTFQATPTTEYLGFTNVDDSISQPTLGKDLKIMFTPDNYKTEADIEYSLTRGDGNFDDKLGNVKKKLGIEDPKERDYLDENKQLLQQIAALGEQARNRDFMREGIRGLMNAPLIGAQAQMAAAEGINRLTIGNLGAMAAQNRVLESNPPKQRIASLKYFRG
tara:strand:+ start:48 stop:632 length:585 start_codon:yes stop_codon:yes gene_type:complete